MFLDADSPDWVAGDPPFDSRAGLFYYSAGRILGKHYYALTLLYMTTHDPALLVEMKRLMALLDPLLTAYPTAPYDLDDVLTYNLVALHALVMAEAGEASESTAWQARIEARVNGIWHVKMPTFPVLWDNLTHIYAIACSTCVYMHLLTNDPRYLEQFNTQRALFLNEIRLVTGSYAWDHRMPLNGDIAGSGVGWSLGWQNVEYARYTLHALLMMHLLGYSVLTPEQLAATVARCIQDNVLSNDVTGAGVYPQKVWQLGLYGVLAKWEGTGKIASFSAAQYVASEKSIFIPVSQIVATA